MPRLMTKLGVVLMFMLLVSMTLAREEVNIGTPDTLLDTLALIPDTPQTRVGILSYADFRAMEAARPGAAHPTSYDEFDALSDDLSGGLWMAAMMGIMSGASNLREFSFMSEDMPRLIGLGFFDIDQSVEYGNPPEQGTIFRGQFDLDAVQAALTDRDYEATETEHGTIWCGPVGCEHGADTDIQGREPANPFGGNLGQQQPMLISDTYMIGSPNLTNIENHAAVLDDSAPSLADAPAYVAVVKALDERNILIQAQFVQAADITQSLPDLFQTLNPTAQEEFYSQLDQDFTPFAPFELAAITDSANETQQVAQVMLAYSTADDAQTAIDVIPQRIAHYTSFQTKIPIIDLFEEREMQLHTSVYTNDDLGKSVAILTFTAPLAPSEEAESGPSFVSSSMAFRLLIQMLYVRDLGWLVPELPPLEDLTGG